MEKSIAAFVMLDAFFPESGQALSIWRRRRCAKRSWRPQRNGAATIPPRSAAMFNVNETGPRLGRCAMHAAAGQMLPPGKVTLTGARERIAEKTYIRATAYPSQPFDQALAKARARGWRSHEVACGHDVMLDAPERLAEILLGEAAPSPDRSGPKQKPRGKAPGRFVGHGVGA